MEFSALQKSFRKCYFFVWGFLIYCSMATASSVSPKKKARSMEARRRRSRNKKTNARVKSQKSPYLLPEPCDSDVHEDCVAIDCEMIVVHSKDRSGRNALASVAIVNKELECVYEKFVQPPSDHRINKSSRQFCPVTDQQFEIAHYCPCTLFAEVRQDVLQILQR